jgi:hypothetical protein
MIPGAYIAHECPNCEELVYIDPDLLEFKNENGLKITNCPKCRNHLTIPRGLLDMLTAFDDDEQEGE